MSQAASRYAKSLIEIAQEQKALEAVHDDMFLLGKTCDENRELALVLKNPIVPHDKKLKILKSLFGKTAHPLTIAIFDIVTRKNREAILYQISKEFHRQYNVMNNIGTAKISTSVALDSNQRKTIENLIASAIGKKIELTEKVNPELIGGFIISIEDKQVDNSVKSQITKLKNLFTDNPYISKL